MAKKMPKWPKGLKARIAREEKKAEREKAISQRRRDIEAAKKKLQTLRNKNRRY